MCQEGVWKYVLCDDFIPALKLEKKYIPAFVNLEINNNVNKPFLSLLNAFLFTKNRKLTYGPFFLKKHMQKFIKVISR